MISRAAPRPISCVSLAQLSAAAYLPLGQRLTFGATARLGVLVPLGPKNSPNPPRSHLVDRFVLGGPHSLWGFRTHGAGPREQRHTATGLPGPTTPYDSLGGEILGAAALSVSTPLPGKLAVHGVRAQAFAAAGTLQQVRDLSAAPSLSEALGAGMRACVGVGLVAPTQFGRAEINLTHVLRKRPTDLVQRHGVQIGVSATVY